MVIKKVTYVQKRRCVAEETPTNDVVTNGVICKILKKTKNPPARDIKLYYLWVEMSINDFQLLTKSYKP